MAILKIREQQKEWALKAAVALAAIVLCFLTLIHPMLQNIAVLHQTILDSQTRSQLFREIQELNKNVGAGESSLPTVMDRSMLLGKISDIASRTKVDVGTLTPRTEPDGGYIKLKIEMEGTGSFFALLNFLQSIEKLSTSLKVKDVAVLRQVSETPQVGKNVLQIHIVFETFLKQRTKKDNA